MLTRILTSDEANKARALAAFDWMTVVEKAAMRLSHEQLRWCASPENIDRWWACDDEDCRTGTADG